MSEDWRIIEDFPNYMISSLGNVKSLNYSHTGKEQLLKPSIRSRYNSVVLCNEKGGFNRPIHRLVALAFIPNPENKPTVDHINRDTSDNCLENLRWATHKEQCANKGDMPSRGTNTGEPYISQNTLGYFQVQKKINGIKHRKTCGSLKEAIQFRDALLEL